MAFDHTGHRRLGDGSLLRLDFELGRWVGSHYRPNLTVRQVVRGELDDVAAVLESWAGTGVSDQIYT
jgi:hypothetical protein